MFRQRLLATLIFVISTTLALIFGEVMLGVYSSDPVIIDDMDAGLIRYHSRYGWNVTPGWQGEHNHSDYSVRYRVGPTGFRADPNEIKPVQPNATVSTNLVIGDSFTFGLGANDDETFVSLLNRTMHAQRFQNAAVPGYSPEQMLLKASDLSRAIKPDTLITFIYLGNDLIDIGLEFPVQAEFPKPFARTGSGGWEIAGIPVAKHQKPAAARQQSLGSFVIEPGSQSWLSSTHTGIRLINSGLLQDSAELNMTRINNSLDLFAGFLDAMNQIDVPRKLIILLPGSVAMTQPDSITGRYQQYLETMILEQLQTRGIFSWSLSTQLRQHPDTANLYYPNDGHLTPEGHRVVASNIMDALATLK